MSGGEKLFEMPTLRGSGDFVLPSDDEAESRIYGMYQKLEPWQKEEGFGWYFRASEQCELLRGEFAELRLDHDRIAAIVAALSPQASWEQNLYYARLLLLENRAPTLTHAVESARRIRDGEDPISVLHHHTKNNLKVRSFHSNIANPDSSDAVTIDRHAWNLIFNDPKAIKKSRLYIRPPEYAWASDRYRSVAAVLGCKPHQVQAATWLGWKPYAVGDRPLAQRALQYTMFESV